MSKKDKKLKNKEAEAVENTQAVENAEAVEAPAEKNKNANFKVMITRCIAAVVSTVIVCVSVANGTSKYAETKVKVAELTPVTVSASTNGGSNTVVSGNTDTAPQDGTSYNEDTGDVTDNSTDVDVVTPDDSTTGTADNDESKAPASAAEMSKAQVVSMFNNAANSAKSSAKSIHQNYTKNTQVTGIELSNKMLASLADKLIAANMGEDKNKHDKTYTGADKSHFPVEGQSWASKLTDADVKEATAKDANGDYSVVIKLVDDTKPNLKVGEGHAGKAFSLVTKEQIVEGAGSAGMAVIKEESIKVSHSGCVIKATIDKNGKLKKANYYRVWKLELTALGIDIGISFGIEEDYVINW